MCGIAGILTPGPLSSRHRAGLAAMRGALRHRGPDGQGEWTSPCGTAAFAHTRLAVFDRTAAAAQPMSIANGRFTITYNGAIYNLAELRRSLGQRGIRFETHSDTEVILRLYEREGAAAIEQLRGMFALAIWDAGARSCLLARDRFGIKPLYYAVTGGAFAFASEVRALWQSSLVSPDLDPDALYGYLRCGSVPEPATLLREVKCLPAGHHVTWSGQLPAPQPYWHLRFGSDGSPETAVADTRRVLADSVERHFAGDAPVGVFLSGGVDSSAIVALASAAGRRGVKTFSLSFPGTPDDEGPLARRTAEHFGAEHHTCEMNAVTARSALAAYTRAADQPSIDGLNTYVMAEFARAGGATVVLSGVGADELFGGYHTFTGVPRLAAWHKRFAWTGAVGAGVGRLVESAAPDVRSRRVADMISRAPGLDNAYQAYRGIFTHAEATALAGRFLDADAGPFALPREEAGDSSPQDTVSRFELTRYVRNQLLRDGDVMSMAFGVELRTPYLDAEVVDCVSAIPAAVRLERGKALLRRAVPEIPPWVARQPKRCFQFPFEHWIDGEWRKALTAADDTYPAGTIWYRTWCVFALESWMSKIDRAAHV